MLQILNKYSARIALSEVRSLSHKGRGQRIGQILDEYWANIFLLLGKYSTDVGLILDKYWTSQGEAYNIFLLGAVYDFLSHCPTSFSQMSHHSQKTLPSGNCNNSCSEMNTEMKQQQRLWIRSFTCPKRCWWLSFPLFDKYDIQKFAGLKRDIGNSYWWESILWQIQGNFCKGKITITAEVCQLLLKIYSLLTRFTFDQV